MENSWLSAKSREMVYVALGYPQGHAREMEVSH